MALSLLEIALVARLIVHGGGRNSPSSPDLGKPRPDEDLEMPTATPIATISPANRLFGSATLNAQRDGFNPDRVPSTYYMNATGEFARLRPLHKDGFALLRHQTRTVGIYTGDWDSTRTFTWNQQNNGNIVFRDLGNSAANIANAITALTQGATLTTAQVQQHNAAAAQQPHLDKAVAYVTDGSLAGCFVGGDQQITLNEYHPMSVVDASSGNSTNFHTGHVLLTAPTVAEFYDQNFPGMLVQLMQLGQSPQSIAVDLAPRGRSITVPIMSNVQYFPVKMFPTPEDQSALVRAMIMSFV
ncbi:hypothetical protein J0X15_11845 [Roseibium sp. CAU 1637]|uniref:Uncharacterized protein n=1 Tax=Roseibium limicola TaxID=2816037 RepID=A0A939EPG3_9HYPH|nr:hypothetical protein [Roseibium limicola]MBO0345915.1 hypothetical protein [Roseibium limicola]